MVTTQRLSIDSVRDFVNHPQNSKKECYIEVTRKGAILVIGEPDSNTSIGFGIFQDDKELKIFGTGW